MRILFLGDIVGRTGRDTVGAKLPELRQALRIDLAIINAENASHGFGLSPDMAKALFEAGADVITLGNHAWDRKEIIPYIADNPRLIRPLNYPPGTPGNGSVLVTLRDGRKALVLQAMGRLFEAGSEAGRTGRWRVLPPGLGPGERAVPREGTRLKTVVRVPAGGKDASGAQED